MSRKRMGESTKDWNTPNGWKSHFIYKNDIFFNNFHEDEDMEEFQDTLTRCAKLEVRKKAALHREARLAAKHHHERKQLQLAQDSMYKVMKWFYMI